MEYEEGETVENPEHIDYLMRYGNAKKIWEEIENLEYKMHITENGKSGVHEDSMRNWESETQSRLNGKWQIWNPT
jgi:uncharacterized GH25 family protein